jgi:signal transduction histidine kinase
MTLRLRLTLLYGGVFIAAGAGLLAVTYGLFKHSQNSTAQVSVRARGVSIPANLRAALTAHPPGNYVVAGPKAQISVTASPKAEGTTRLFLPKGTTPPPGLIKQIEDLSNGRVAKVTSLANVALHRQQSNDASSLLEWSGIALAVVALLSIGLAWWLSGRALRPLRTMNARAREISAENLHERLSVDGRGDELGELGATFDALLGRLEAAFDSQRRFVANASHELRTPLTLERTLAEVALADPDATAESLRRVCERVVASTEQQERLLDALLTLARSEGGVASGGPVDLATLVDEALMARESQMARIAVERDLEPTMVLGDVALLERVVGNLLDNAIVHNGGDNRWIRVATGERGGAPGLVIANGGEVVAPDRVEGLFEPFRRGAGDRVGGSEGGLGLGLSIVKAVVIAHAGRVTATALSDGGLEFELRFASDPAAKPPVGGVEPVTAF